MHTANTRSHVHRQLSTTVSIHTHAYSEHLLTRTRTQTALNNFIERNPPPLYYVPSSRTVCKRTPLEGFVSGSSRGVLLHTVLDEGT